MNVTISNGVLIASINTLGAELNSLKDNSGREYIWQGDPKFWGKHSPVLFPIVGTLKKNTYTFNENTYNLSRHGFAREREFVVKSQTDKSVVFSLSADDKSREVFPFEFELEISYTLEAQTLRIDYSVSNLSDTTMPFSIGAHPAFALSEDFDSYSLKFEHPESPEYYLLDDNGLISEMKNVLPLNDGELLLNYELFENDALIFKKLKSKSLSIHENGNPLIEIDYSRFPNLGLWTKQEAPFLCIEPWQGFADTIGHNGHIIEKEGIINLDQGKLYETGFSIKIIGQK